MSMGKIFLTMFDSSQFWSFAVADADQRRAIWVPCAMCWGQRRIFEDLHGQGLVACTCPGCLGLGERLVV